MILAAAAKADPVAFRMKLSPPAPPMTPVSNAHARLRYQSGCGNIRMGYTTFAARPRGNGNILTGRGIAYTFRSQTVVAQIAEVEVNRQTGHVWVKRLVCAHDCGLVINPEGLRRTVENGMMHSLSRALHEEVQFDTEKVTSVDWNTHPTLTHRIRPQKIDVVIVNGDPNPKRPDFPQYGAGETRINR